MTCDKCGKALQMGEWPFCGGKNTHGFPVAGVQVVSDELPQGPYWCETLGHEPVYVTSKSHLRREAAMRGFDNVVRHDDRYYATRRKRHDEELRDTGTNKEF